MSSPSDVLGFWFADGIDAARKVWFERDDSFDQTIRDRFGATLELAGQGALDHWKASAEDTLALAIVLDQFPRNLFRGTARAFAFDDRARGLAADAVRRGLDLALTPLQRIFMYLPFEHGETIADQDLSVALFEGLRDTPLLALPDAAIDYAWRHRAVIQRFGRFPHRNAALGRTSTPEEQAWLAAGGGF